MFKIDVFETKAGKYHLHPMFERVAVQVGVFLMQVAVLFRTGRIFEVAG